MFTESLGKVVSNFQFEHLIVIESAMYITEAAIKCCCNLNYA